MSDIIEIAVIYLGRFETSKHKVGARFIPAELYHKCKSESEVIEKSSGFEWKEKDLPRAIGRVYMTKGTLADDLHLKTISGVKWISAEDDKHHIKHEWIASWQARDEAARVAARARKQFDKIAKDNYLSESLRRLKYEYGKTDTIGKLALEVVVLAVLRG